MADSSTEPVCSTCKATSSLMWHRNQDSEILCLGCYSCEKNRTMQQDQDTPPAESQTPGQQDHTSPLLLLPSRRVTRQSKLDINKEKQVKQNPKAQSQSVSSSQNGTATTNSTTNSTTALSTLPATLHTSTSTTNSTKASATTNQKQGRHSLWKQQLIPVRSPLAQGSITTSDSVIHKGTTYEVGDVVSLLDRDGGVYYAVIRGFLQDEYSVKFAALTWLLPMHPNPTHFDPSTFVLGPEEDRPQEMDYMEFVCHSPQSRHFQASYSHDIEQTELWQKNSLPS